MTNKTERDDRRPYWPDTFKIGDRVRVRLTKECPLYGDTRMGTPVSAYGHIPESDGATGTIAPPTNAWIKSNLDDGHNIFVLYDQPVWVEYPIGLRGWVAGIFAATELELLEAVR